MRGGGDLFRAEDPRCQRIWSRKRIDRGGVIGWDVDGRRAGIFRADEPSFA